MADTAAIYSLISGLGGAVIGAGATVFASSRQHRREISEQGKERRRLQAKEEIVRLTSLRFAGRAWLEVALQAQHRLASGVDVDPEKFDQDIKEAGGVAAKEGYCVILPDPSVEQLAAEIFDRLDHLSWQLRREILSPSRDRSSILVEELGSSLQEVAQRRATLNAKISERIEELALAADTPVHQSSSEV
ncbi:hypothetical protein JW613_32020 [Streptomyces smyrnaeus]|uniref:Uncharacterized protein n=1 Tax=Streptomyces smyrnaeus TaxID=1387713 RepID=A0ABS3Y5V0_9ACTN|nr:hypothetical protein [Streptomyces smyrnaeus]MBO8202868.1 hypothetical protein [Streptomyces smyrnaeus]